LPGSPDEKNPSNAPDAGGNSTMRAELTQTGDDFGGSPQFAMADSPGSSPSFDNISTNPSNPLTLQDGNAGPNRTSRASSPRANYEAEGGSDGLLAAYGNVMGGNVPSGTPLTAGSSMADSMQRPDRRFRPMAKSQPPEMIRKLSPYESVPSLYDMYVQTVTRPAAPRRFDAEVFENGTQGSQSIPMDLPAGPDYVVGPGDALSIELWGGIAQRLSRTVDREGRVSLPEVGPILVSGKSLAAVQQNL
jgi:hypothetical protein